MMNLGGLFGETLQRGCWSPWGARADIDEFVTMNKVNNLLKIELDDWMWVNTDKLSFHACSSTDTGRTHYTLDTHDTARRLPHLWKAYLDFCDRIDKPKFRENVNYIVGNNVVNVKTKLLKEIMKEVIV
jgi:hypothetical protein